jgi:hypothetical protein
MSGHGVVDAVESTPTQPGDKPRVPIAIADAGELTLDVNDEL